METTCVTCGMAGQGYKCDVCGVESVEPDPNHVCGSDHCVVKCSGCGEAENNCTCPPAPDVTSGPATDPV